MKLDIYGKKDGKKQIVKTYEVKEYDIMFGAIEDLTKEVKLDDLADINDAAIIRLVGRLMVDSMDTIKDLLMDIFDGITEEEIRNTKVKDVARVLVDAVLYTIIQIDRSFSWGSSKNAEAVRTNT